MFTSKNTLTSISFYKKKMFDTDGHRQRDNPNKSTTTTLIHLPGSGLEKNLTQLGYTEHSLLKKLNVLDVEYWLIGGGGGGGGLPHPASFVEGY